MSRAPSPARGWIALFVCLLVIYGAVGAVVIHRTTSTAEQEPRPAVVASPASSSTTPPTSQTRGAAPPSSVAEPAQASAADPFAGIPARPKEAPFHGTAVAFDLARLDEALPAGFALDGRVDEWVTAPGGSLPASAGEGRLWSAITETAFVVAGDVDAKLDGITLDKVQIDLSFAPPELPRIAFRYHLYESVVDDAWCRAVGTLQVAYAQEAAGYSPTKDNAKAPTGDDKDACLRWLSRSEDLRAWISRRFVRTAVLDLAKGTVTGVDGAKLVVRRRSPGGTQASFELEIPSSSFPETSEMPLRIVRVATKSFSARQKRLPKEVTVPLTRGVGWTTFIHSTGLSLHRAPELVARILDQWRVERSNDLLDMTVSYVPSAGTSDVHFFYNQMWNEDRPEHASPQVRSVDVTHGRTLFTLKGESPAGGDDIDIVAHTVGFDYFPRPLVALVSERGDRVLDISEFTKFDPYTLVKRAPGVHVLNVYRGSPTEYGYGECGAATGYGFEIMTMDSTGHFGRIEPTPIRRDGYGFDASGLGLELGPGCQLLGVESLPAFQHVVGQVGADLTVDSRLRFFGLHGTLTRSASRDDESRADVETRSYEALYRWVEADGAYVLSGRVFAPPP